jgi:hypothetical protein
MKRKGHLYIHIHQVFSKTKSFFYKLIIVYYSLQKKYARTSIVIGISKRRQIIQGHKVLGGIISAID